jgi:hypothetical protein
MDLDVADDEFDARAGLFPTTALSILHSFLCREEFVLAFVYIDKIMIDGLHGCPVLYGCEGWQCNYGQKLDLPWC